MSFSTQSHAESFRNFIKKSVLDPKHAKLNQNSDFGHVRTVGRRAETPVEPPCAARTNLNRVTKGGQSGGRARDNRKPHKGITSRLLLKAG